MATAKVSQLNFRFDIAKISELNEVSSQDFVIHNISWAIKAKAVALKGEKWLYLYLLCQNKDNSLNQTHTAYATGQLVSFNVNTVATKFYSMTNVYDNIYLGHGGSIIRWCDLIDPTKGYMNDDSISLDVTIHVADPQDKNKPEMVFEEVEKSCDDGCKSKFRLSVTNIEKLIAVCSPKIVLRKMSWYLTAYKNNLDEIAVRLDILTSSNDFSCEVNMLTKLIPAKEDSFLKTIEQTVNGHVLRNATLSTKSLISLGELLKPGSPFVENNSIVIEVEINTEKPKGVDLAAIKHGASTSTTSIEAKIRKLECAICFEDFDGQGASFTPCGHLFCSPCIEKVVEREKICPSCRSPVQLNELKRAHLPFTN
ncbi:uncharacterized protein LOC129567040 [Sitodiplosis mosellana]|uniref:uncharacterized protein LOC129567040 n=1 Tax=Sitodiplosis mosellana TaxID=263140 RepID=UPI002443BE75|nr:uncharacterized protein LOC129567040 [Sitodiplosis mosellana]